MKVQKEFLEIFKLGDLPAKKLPVCPNIADLVQKVRFTAIMHYFDLDITSYGLFGIDKYKIKTSETLNDQIML